MEKINIYYQEGIRLVFVENTRTRKFYISSFFERRTSRQILNKLTFEEMEWDKKVKFLKILKNKRNSFDKNTHQLAELWLKYS